MYNPVMQIHREYCARCAYLTQHVTTGRIFKSGAYIDLTGDLRQCLACERVHYPEVPLHVD